MDTTMHEAAWHAFPGFRQVARSRYRRRFRTSDSGDNLYFGVYDSHDDALADARRLATAHLPPSYDLDAAGRMYRAQLEGVRVSDYPLLYWLQRAFADGARRVFDLGGNIGVSYYGFSRFVDYPDDLAWTVHDLPRVIAVGRQWAQAHDATGRLRFADAAAGADGQDVLLSSGALQYLPYTLPELLDGMRAPPRRVLVNLTPMHETREFFTLQNLGIAICPYRIASAQRLLAQMQALGYRVQDRWFSRERHLCVPFHPDTRIDGYTGACFVRDPH